MVKKGGGGHMYVQSVRSQRLRNKTHPETRELLKTSLSCDESIEMIN